MLRFIANIFLGILGLAIVRLYGLALTPLFCLLLVVMPAFAQNYTVVSESTFGGDVVDIANDVLQMPSGNFFLAGYTKSIGAGKEDVWLVQTDESGSLIWQKTIGGLENDACNSMSSLPDGGLILAGYTQSKGSGNTDIWLIRLDAQGTPIWEHTFGGKDADKASAVVPTSDGGFGVVGYYFKPKNDQSLYSSDLSPLSVTGGSVTTLPSSTQRVQALWLIKTNASGSMMWNESFDFAENTSGAAIIEAGDGSLIVGGNSLSSSRSSEAIIIKMSADGEKLWQKNFGSPKWDAMKALSVTTDGKILAAGTTFSQSAQGDAWVICLDANGTLLWEKIWGSTENESIEDIELMPDGRIITLFNIVSPNQKPDLWALTELDAYGNIINTSVFGTHNMQQTHNLCKTQNDKIAVIGAPTTLRKCYEKGDRNTWLIQVKKE